MKTERNAYHSHRGSAKKRGIPFHFSFEEWVHWWESELGGNWLQLRGCRRGQYVMARLGDKGAYENGNVKCVLVEANHRERKSLKGIAHGRARLTEFQVKRIKLSSLSKYVLAKRYGVAPNTIGNIKRGLTWKHVGSSI